MGRCTPTGARPPGPARALAAAAAVLACAGAALLGGCDKPARPGPPPGTTTPDLSSKPPVGAEGLAPGQPIRWTVEGRAARPGMADVLRDDLQGTSDYLRVRRAGADAAECARALGFTVRPDEDPARLVEVRVVAEGTFSWSVGAGERLGNCLHGTQDCKESGLPPVLFGRADGPVFACVETDPGSGTFAWLPVVAFELKGLDRDRPDCPPAGAWGATSCPPYPAPDERRLAPAPGPPGT